MALDDNPLLESTVGLLSGFYNFLLQGNVVDTAVGIVVGVAFTNLVNALVKDFFTPLIAVFFNMDFSDLKFKIGKSTFFYGDFLNYMISFIIICFVLYFFVVLPYTNAKAYFYPHKTNTTDCPECKETIPAAATRCKFCTSQVQPKSSAA